MTRPNYVENDAEALALAASTRVYGNGKPEEAERLGDGWAALGGLALVIGVMLAVSLIIF